MEKTEKKKKERDAEKSAFFKRQESYSDATIDYLKELLEKEKDLKDNHVIDEDKGILFVPQSDFIKAYYFGKTLLESISDNSFSVFGDGYVKYFDAKYHNNSNYYKDKVLAKIRGVNVVPDEGLTQAETKKKYVKEKLGDIIECIKLGHASQIERSYQTQIALNNMSYEPDKYSVCGFETKVPFRYIEEEPEIDLVAICPEKKKLALIEFKCKKGAIYKYDTVERYKEGQSIVKHGADYLQVKHLALKPLENQFNFVEEMVKSYQLMKKIYCPEGKEIAIDPRELEIEIVFLITKDLDKEITKDTFATAKRLMDLFYENEIKNTKYDSYWKQVYYQTEKLPKDVILGNWCDKLMDPDSEEWKKRRNN